MGTSQDAIMAHEACKKVARAPHGCWIGLSSPYEQWDNGLPMKAITGKSWKDDQEPAKEDGKCVEIDKDGMWRAIPCVYDRHVLCNVRGTVTRQALQDEEYMKKRMEGQQQKKIDKAAEVVERERALDEQVQSESESVSEKKDGGGSKSKSETGMNPVAEEIERLQKILKKQE